jgi:prophage maintenance system killer protein
VNREFLVELSKTLRATPADADPAIPAGRALYFLVFRQPFWDCNKRTGWSVCAMIMTAMGFAQVLPDEQVESLVLQVENGQVDEAETIEGVRRAFRPYRAKRR